jgi:hypothetical protein
MTDAHARYFAGLSSRLDAAIPCLLHDLVLIVAGYTDDFIERAIDKAIALSPTYKCGEEMTVSIAKISQPRSRIRRAKYLITMTGNPEPMAWDYSTSVKLCDMTKAIGGWFNAKMMLRHIHDKHHRFERSLRRTYAITQIAKELVAAYDASAESIVKNELMVDTIRAE